MFKFAYNTAGRVGIASPNPIVAATAIELGEIVDFTVGVGIVAAAGDDFDDPALGVAAEAHDGTTAGRQSGTEIKVYDDEFDVFKVVPRDAITATGGSTTTFVDSNLPNVNDLFNGGAIIIVSCAADASLVGRKVYISDYTGATGTITLAETLPAALAAGDTAYLCPGKLARGTYSFDTNADNTDIDWETSAGEALLIVNADPDTFELFVRLRLYRLGSHMLTITV
jgi:hypothetical protein